MIEIKDLTISFGRKKAIRDLNLAIPAGESILLAGANGSGKTSLLRAIAGMLRPNRGRILMAGRKAGPGQRQRIAYIPTAVSHYDSMNLQEAIAFHGRFYDRYDYQPLQGPILGNPKISSLSKGEKTLFILSLALATHPDYLLIDDVIHFLDPHLREIFLNSVLQLIAEEHLTVVIAAQSAFDIEGLPERLVVLTQGSVMVDETVEDLKKKFVRIFSTSVPDHVPVVYSREWPDLKEIYIYPYSSNLSIKEKIEHLSLPQILRALIGGEYDRH